MYLSSDKKFKGFSNLSNIKKDANGALHRSMWDVRIDLSSGGRLPLRKLDFRSTERKLKSTPQENSNLGIIYIPHLMLSLLRRKTMAYNTTPLGNWLEDLFRKMFYQPDDGISQKAMDEGISPALKISINGKDVPADTYKQLIMDTRRTHRIAVKSSRELLASSAAADPEIGSVTHPDFHVGREEDGGEKRTDKLDDLCD
ncbi:hypothetical protein CNMCM5623_003131 [Aspergillus felis]|uniref:Uncharacterized protein n=1 Tax=Aspergillus felis TaxID=1287682 RepID=A0A8H6UHD6_9EURO|nr:hypothetical protein CNMCM5623_003131 [Aspergillus felis]